MNFSIIWKRVKSLVKLFADTFDPLRITLIVKLPCGCTMSELVNVRQTVTCLEFSRHPDCRKLSHFTGSDAGWPQIEDAVNATILHSDASSAKLGEREQTICELRKRYWVEDDQE